MMSQYLPTLAIALAASLASAGCKKKDPPASPPARSGDTAATPAPSAAPKPSAAPQRAAPPTLAAPEPRTPPPAPPNHDTAADDSTGEDTADRAAAAEANAVITDERRLAAIQNRAEQIHQQYDANHDGKLSPEELGNARGRRARFDDPVALDIDHDGDISPDELAAGLKARAEVQRAELVGAGGGSQQP